MLLNKVLILHVFVCYGVFANDDLCRLAEFDVPQGLTSFDGDELEEKLFYKTDFICQNKPVFRSMKSLNLYQFQSPNNRRWTLYDTSNSTYQLGMREWCGAWNMKPLLSMPLGMFQYPLGKQKKTQRWQRVIVHEKNNSYSYKPVSNVYLKCHYPPSASTCETHQLTFLYDLTATTNDKELAQMKSLTKTLIWLLYNQTKISLSYYRDRFHLVNSFDRKTSSKSLEHLFDSIETMAANHLDTPRRFSVRWPEAIHQVVTEIFKRRFLLPIQVVNSTRQFSSKTNDSTEDDDDDEIYTEPYPLVYSDEHAIKTILNITTRSDRQKRAKKNDYDKSKHVLVILTSRSKYLHDYKQRDKHLAQLIASVPLRILVIDFHQMSNKKVAEHIHSAFIQNAKYALVSSPAAYNYIDTYEEFGDVVHGNQLFDQYHRICHPMRENVFADNFITTIIASNPSPSRTMDCSLLSLFTSDDENSTLKEKFDYTFYQTSEQCYLAPVYRSLGDRNLYVQKISNGQWLINRVDPLLPSTMSLQRQAASTTTSTLSPEFFDATDYANGPMIDEMISETSHLDLPLSVPHCSNTPGIDIVWESDGGSLPNDYSLLTPRRWTSDSNQSDVISPICNKYQISCHRSRLDLLILADSQREYASLIQTFLRIFLSLIEPFDHRLSLVVLSSTTTDTLQYHLPFTSFNTIDRTLLDNYFSYLDDGNSSIIPLSEHMERLSEYLRTNQQAGPSQQILLTIPSRLNFNREDMKKIVESHPTIRYMALDPSLKTDDDDEKDRKKFLRSLTSSPTTSNQFWSYVANRDLTFNTVFRVLESLCGHL